MKNILESCRTFADIDSHVSELVSRFKLAPERRAAAQKSLRDLYAQGLLISADGAIHPEPDSNPTGYRKISTIAFVTCDRPSKLAKCYRSYQGACNKFGREVEFLIMDDSKDELSTRAGMELVRATTDGCRVQWAGRSEKGDFVEQLAAEGLDPDVLRFALLGEFGSARVNTVGANRNCVLLDTLGEHVFMVDDDTLCLAVDHPDRGAGLDFVGHEEAREVEFFRSRAEVISSLTLVAKDMLAEHEMLLGLSLSRIANLNLPVFLDRACDHLLAALQSGKGVVVASMSGVAGDSGGYSGQWLLGAQGRTQQRLWSNECVLHTGFTSREVLSVANKLTVSHYFCCHGTTLAIANSLLLPPFLPQYTNEDGFFGSLVGLTMPYGFLGHVPVAIFHDSEPGRTYACPEFRMADLVISLLLFSGPRPHGDTVTACRTLGKRLQEIAELPPHEFWYATNEAAVRQKRMHIATYERVVRSSDPCPPYVAARLNDLIRTTAQALVKPEFTVPADLKSHYGTEQARLMCQQFVGLCGRLLAIWPSIVECASEFKKRGGRLSRCLSAPIRSTHERSVASV